MKRAYFIVPGLCFLILGMGNLWVGHLKGTEYKEVSERLNSVEFKQGEAYLPLARISQDRAYMERSLDRRLKADHRKDFYSVVYVIGKCLTVLGVFLLCSAALISKKATNPEFSSSIR